MTEDIVVIKALLLLAIVLYLVKLAHKYPPPDDT